jgi:hypothetical protein
VANRDSQQLLRYSLCGPPLIIRHSTLGSPTNDPHPSSE